MNLWQKIWGNHLVWGDQQNGDSAKTRTVMNLTGDGLNQKNLSNPLR
jgi:hypothetical protein